MTSGLPLFFLLFLTALLILIANARYLLMSTALSQKLSPDLSFFHRILIGFDITDELYQDTEC